MFQGKKILLGVTGSIAAYKSLLLVRLLIREGATVRVIQTPASRDFVTSLSLSTLSRHPVLSDLFAADTWANHVELGRWADIFLIAPLSCNTLAKMAQGLCDNLLLATYLSAVCPVVVAPAMDEDMWRHPSNRTNLERLRSFGNLIIPVRNGELASGLYGDGRMAEPEEIMDFVGGILKGKDGGMPVDTRADAKGTDESERETYPSLEGYERVPNSVRNEVHGRSSAGGEKGRTTTDRDLAGKRVLVTAGPTYEAIDPVRFIGNHSSGKMGIALAEELAGRGAQVDLVLGPSVLSTHQAGITTHRVISAAEMYNACMESFRKSDIAIMSAAVADYTPVEVAAEKIKKSDSDSLMLELTRTKDILKALGDIKKKGQVLVGFALETRDEKAYALSKLQTKNADLIVLNSAKDEGAGFGVDTNKITIFSKDGQEWSYEQKPKQQVAKDIVDQVVKLLYV
jgi:phosphopantothenoylcysteine decarboxylase/phosphopantothenate--cysteine ligase